MKSNNWIFSEDYLNNFSTELSSQIFDCCPRNFLIEEERIGNVVSTSHWIRPVSTIQAKQLLCIAIDPVLHVQGTKQLFLRNHFFLFRLQVYTVGLGIECRVFQTSNEKKIT